MAAIATIECAPAAHSIELRDDPLLPDLEGLSLRIFDTIPVGFGVVAVTGDDAGSHLLRQGEVAVFDERWRGETCRDTFRMTPGLYCYERQRAPSSMPNSMIADRFRDNDPVMMTVEREVVFVFPHPRRPDCWAYRQLRSRLYRGVRLTSRIEGPIYPWGILEMLRGPIVGIYRPTTGGLN